jgi:hypothetical protein
MVALLSVQVAWMVLHPVAAEELTLAGPVGQGMPDVSVDLLG